MRRAAIWIAAILMGLGILASSNEVQSQAQPSLGQTPTPSPSPTTGPACRDRWVQIDRDDRKSGNYLEGVATVSSNIAWASGNTSTDRGQPIPLIKKWDGSGWARERIRGRFFLHDIDQGNTGPVWTVGEGSSGSTLSSYALRRVGGEWKRTPIVNKSSTLTAINDVSALSRRHVWASGTYWDSAAQHRVLIEHWNGRRWSVAPVSTAGLLDDIYARARDDVWAVGRTVRDDRAVPLTLRFNGRRWRQVPSPTSGTGPHYLYGVSSSGRRQAWAVGERSAEQGLRPVPILLQWDGDRWANRDPGLPDRARAVLRAVSVFGDEVVAVGSYWTRTTSPEALVLTHTPGNGWVRELMTWSEDSDDLYDVDHAPNGAVYAAGYRSTMNGSEAVFYRPPLCP